MSKMERIIGGAGIEAATDGVVPFLFEGEHMLRSVAHDDNPWFVAADACAILSIKNATQAVQALDDDERAMLNIGRQGEANIVSEGGLYTLILRSRLATTPGTVQHRFRKWVTGEVLPAIRKTGGYGAAQGDDAPELEEAPDLTMKIRMVNACRPIFGNQAAGQLWFYLGLPDMPAMHPDPRQLTIFDYQQIKVEGDAA